MSEKKKKRNSRRRKICYRALFEEGKCLSLARKHEKKSDSINMKKAPCKRYHNKEKATGD
jgi:hypothetical protein